MKKVLVFLCAVLMLSYGNVWAEMGSYTITDVQDGGSWTEGTPAELVLGQTYEVTMDVSYDDAPNEHLYHDFLTASIDIGGSEVWNASGWYSTQTTFPNGDVDSATWTLVGNLIVPDVSEGIYLATASVLGPFGIIELASLEHDVNLTNSGSAAPVPEPATILLVGSGLIGICAFSRSRKKASS